MKLLPPQNTLKEYFYYDSETGVFSRIKSSGGRSKLGPITKKNKGYLVARFQNKSYYVHRLVFQYVYNKCPKIVDHVNGNKLDNCLLNLRSASLKQNQGNAKKAKTNTSGYKGVSYHKKTKKWQAHIGSPKKYLGLFKTAKEAHVAYINAARIEYGKYARFN